MAHSRSLRSMSFQTHSENLYDKLLPVLGDSGFFFVENRLFIAMFVLDIIKNPHILLVRVCSRMW